MTPTPTTATEPRELAARDSDGIDVRLLWHGARTLTVAVSNARTGEQFEFSVKPEQALKAYHHPFALRPSRPSRVLYRLDAPALEHSPDFADHSR